MKEKKKKKGCNRSRNMETVEPIDVVDFRCWFGSCAEMRRTIFHAMNCEAVGTTDFLNCSTAPGKCNRRYAHDSLRTNFVFKLAMVYERDLGLCSDWSETMRIGNPVRSNLVHKYMEFSREQQKKAGVVVKQAPISPVICYQS